MATIHPTGVDYPGGLAGLAEDLGSLRYDALAGFLELLSVKLARDGEADAGRGRRRLATALTDAAANVHKAMMDVERAWRISEPHMTAETGE